MGRHIPHIQVGLLILTVTLRTTDSIVTYDKDYDNVIKVKCQGQQHVFEMERLLQAENTQQETTAELP